MFKNLPQHSVIDKGFYVTMIIEWNISLAEFIDVNRNRRNKISKYSFHSIHRDTPDPKEPQDMINAKSIEVMRHLLKSFFPPAKSIFGHFFPIVSGKSPILPFDSKAIRGRASLKIHMI